MSVKNIQANANRLRGVFALFIIFTHCTLAYESLPSMLVPLRKVSTFGVGFFFVSSGYGLAYSFSAKKDYLKGFLSKKISNIFVLALVSRIVSEIVLFLSIDKELSIVGLFRDMNWYIYSLILLYICFYLSYRFNDSRNKKVICLWIMVIAMTVLALCCCLFVKNIGRSYFISQWAFPFGITLYEFSDEFERFANSKKYLLGIFMTLLLGVMFVGALKANEYTLLDMVTHNIMLFPFYYFVMVMCRYFEFKNNLLGFLGKISFEIYLYQFMVLKVLQHFWAQKDVSYFLLTVVFTVLIAWGMNSITTSIKKAWKRG